MFRVDINFTFKNPTNKMASETSSHQHFRIFWVNYVELFQGMLDFCHRFRVEDLAPSRVGLKPWLIQIAWEACCRSQGRF